MDWFNNVSTLERAFWYIAMPSSALFVLMTLLTLLGLHHDSDFDVSHDGDFGMDHGGDMHADGHDSHHDSSEIHASFRPFTFKAFIAFFTLFGWSGILGIHSDWRASSVILFAFLMGCIGDIMVAGIMYGFSRLQCSGTMDIRNAIGQVGELYLPIEPGGTGKVQLPIQGSIRELAAKSSAKEKLPTGTRVTVRSIINSDTVLVEPV